MQDITFLLSKNSVICGVEVVHSIEGFRFTKKPVVTIGIFDGVHLGHLAILQRVTELAQSKNTESIVLTFEPHPRIVLNPNDLQFKLLQSLDEKIERLALASIDKLVVIPFTKEFSTISHQTFIKSYLVDILKVDTVIIGYDHRFGNNRTGGLNELIEAGKTHHFLIEEIPVQQIDSANISSTTIRNALLSNKIEVANQLLGYSYSLSGKVMKDRQLGRTIGFPTANLGDIHPHKLIPANGVYFVEVQLDRLKNHKGMMNIGTRPTVDGNSLSLEVHIFDFDSDLYDKTIQVKFLQFIRNEQKFESISDLQKQLSLDKAFCKKII